MYVGWPTHQAEKAAQAEKEKMEQMVRSGEVREVQSEAITIEVESGGADIGETRKYRINEYSKVQIGMGFIDKPGEKTDLAQWFKEGDYVNLMVDNGQAVVIHRELRPEETESLIPNTPEN